MSDEIYFDGQRFVSAHTAADAADLTRDYVARLCREGKVIGRRLGKSWYVHEESLKRFLVEQAYAKSLRSERLSEERTREYQAMHDTAAQTPVRGVFVADAPKASLPLVSPVTHSLARHAAAAQAKLRNAAMRQGEAAMRFAPSVAMTPGGVQEIIARAAHSTMHVPVHTITPLADFMQKFVAMLVAFTMTFGTYALVDPAYAKFALASMRDSVASVADAYTNLTGGTHALSANLKESALYVSENPKDALAAASSATISFIPDSLRSLARAVNQEVNNFVYAIAFPLSLTNSTARIPDGASVMIEVAPYARSSQQTFSTTSTSGQVVQQVVNPTSVIERERVIERVVAQAGGITEEYLNQRLAALRNELYGQVSVSSGGGGGYTTVSNNYSLIAQSQKIDQLAGVDISDSTFTDGTISGSTLTGIPSLSVSGSASVTGVLSVQTASGQSENPFEVKNASGTTIFSVANDGSIVSSIASSTSSYSALLITGNATATSLHTQSLVVASTSQLGNATSTTLFSTVARFTTGIIENLTATVADITGLTVQNSTTTNATTTNLFALNASTTNATSTNLFAANASITNATTTNLFSALSRFTDSIISALTATVATITNLTATNSTTTNATSTSLAVSGLPSVLLSTRADGGVRDTTIGSSLTFSSNQLSLNTANANNWTALQNFLNASSTQLSAGTAYFGGSATSSFASNGALTLATPLLQASGGTGFGSYNAGDILYADNLGVLTRLAAGSNGQVLKLQAGLPAWGVDVSGGGGGGGDGLWATSTDTSIYPVDTAYTVLVGTNSTSTLNSILEVSGQQYISTKLGIATTSPVTALSVGGNAYLTGGLGVGVYNTAAGTLQTSGSATVGSSLSVLGTAAFSSTLAASGLATFSAGASTTRLSVFGTSYFGGSATSTFSSAGVLNLAGLASAVLGVDASGNVVATSTIGTNLLSGSLGTVNGTTFNRGDSITITAASSTLLANNNTWSGTNAFQNITFTNGTSSTFAVANITSAIPLANADGSLGEYAGTSCTNQFVRSLNGAGVATCATVSLTADVTGVLPIANGGTNASSFGTTNGVSYFDGTRLSTNSNLTFDGTKLTATNASTTFLTAGEKIYLEQSSGTPLSGAQIVSAGGWWGIRMDPSSRFNVDFYNNGTPAALLSMSQIGDLGVGTSSVSGVSLLVQGNDQATTLLNVRNHTESSALSVSGTGFGTTTVSGLAINGSATSTSNVGFNLSGGCFAVNGTCLNNISLSGANTWSALQQFSAGASTTRLSVFGTSYFGGSATSTFSSAGVLNLAGLASAVLGVDASGNVVATSTIGTNLLSGSLGTVNGTTFNRGDSITITAASSTLLANNNTWSGTNIFSSGLLSLASTTIGGGTQATGLTISGGATTTGTHYVSGGITINSSSNSSFLGTGDVYLGGGSLVQGLGGAPDLSVEGYINTNAGINTGGDVRIGGSSASIWTALGGSADLAVQGWINANTGVQTAQGSAATPSLLFYSTNNTGIFATDANASAGIGFSTQGTERARIDNSGKFGIGSTTPWAKLAVTATAGQTNPVFEVASSSAGTTYLSVSGTGFGTTTVSGLAINGSATSTSNVGFNITTGCYAINGTCVGGGGGASLSGTTGQIAYFSGTDTAVGTSTISILSSGRVGIGTSTPYAKLTVWGSGTGTGTLFEAVDSASTTVARLLDNGTGYFLGNIGVGTTSPMSKLSVQNTAAAAQFTLAYSDSQSASFQVDSAGDLIINPSGDDVRLTSDNLFVCNGACQTGTTGTGNIIAENKIGIGTSTPSAKLTIETGNESDAATNLLRIASTTNQSIFLVDADGNVGIGTSTPSKQLSISKLLYVGGGNPVGMGTATSTFQGDVLITGKLDVSTIDPVYTIDGVKYATYGHSTIGVKEELAMLVEVSSKGVSGLYEYSIPFSKLPLGSDPWLFWQVTEFGEDWKDLVVSLTPGFEGDVHYVKDVQTKTLRIISSAPGEVSLRLIADRYDAHTWPNLRPDQGTGFEGHVIQGK